MVVGIITRFSFEAGKTGLRLSCLNTQTGRHGRDWMLSKICFYEPLALSSAMTPIGSVRTKRRMRSVARKKDLEFHLDSRFPFEYTYRQIPNPLTSPGDLDKTLGFVDKTQLKKYFKDSEELKTANDDVKRLFTLDMYTKREVLDAKFSELFQKVQRHPLDYRSVEMKITRKTVLIRNFFEKLNIDPTNVQIRMNLNDLVGKRNKLLHELRKSDEDRFNWLVKVLEVDIERPLLGVVIQKPTRKLEISRLTDEYCEKMRTDKLDAYKAKLKEEQVTFLMEKKNALEWIAETEKSIQERNEQLKAEEEQFWKAKNCRKL